MLFLTTGATSQPNIKADKLRELSFGINEILKTTKAVGVSVALIDDYEIIWAKGFGVTEVGTNDSVTTETLFQAASISKSVTALAVMKKVQDGKISLTGNVNDQLKSWQIPENNLTQQSPVTVKRLLSHTGGVAKSSYYPGYKLGDPLPTVLQNLNGTKPAQNDPVTIVSIPGSMFSYSNCGYWILEALLEDVEMQGFEKILSTEILQPLRMMHTTTSASPPKDKFRSIATGHLKKNIPIESKYYIVRPLSAGGMWSTPTDLANFLIEVQKSRKGLSNRIIDKANAVLMTTSVMSQYGLGFSNVVRGTGVSFFGHDGHNVGYICSMIASLDAGFGVVIMTNSENGWNAVNKIKKTVGRTFWGF